ncbi:alpha/beta hydrolase-fold protein [Fictibacillus enclensis]|uniref:alpha/beta hydrolase n=1 Tax=Fictibacillus enclensis TaxID=1017270 RepID=UPI0025A06A7B|nr:alpha/beta hydrolase-fold protein [Fictibacillus enclensis]MDM5196776.1 alpha/beta hydrolase-fold protein [Fictibacillus enclensis]
METAFSYTIHTPENIKPEKKYPVIFALHGIGYNEHDILELVKELKSEFILIGIRGHLPHESGFAYYYLKGYGNPDRELFDKSMKMLQEFFDYASNKYPIDPGQRYLMGFSQGAILSMSLALVLGEAVKGIVAMNGYIPSFVKEEYLVKPINHMSIFLSDGEFDKIFPPKIGRENYDYLNGRAASVTYTTYAAGHEISQDNQRELVKWLSENTPINS